MRAGEIMTTGAATVRPETTLAEAAQIMVEHRVSGLPVVDDQGKLVGIITEGDFLPTDAGQRSSPFEILARGEKTAGDLRTRLVKEIMTLDPISIPVETPVEEAIERMRSHRIKRLPVLAEGRIVGILSRANVLAALVRRIPA